VFVERGFESFGKQVPAGSPKESETLDQAVLRESEEETGLRKLKIVNFLGSILNDQRKYGLDEFHKRHFFHIECIEETPTTWIQEEKDPSIILPQTPERIIFDLSWIDLKSTQPILSEGHDAFLTALKLSMEL